MKNTFLSILLVILSISQSYSQNNPFWEINHKKTTQSVNANKYLAQAEHYDAWDSVSNLWINFANANFTYNNLGLVSEKISVDKNNIVLSKEVYSYDAFGNMLMMTNYMMDTISNTLNPTYRIVKSYHLNKFESLVQNETWDKNTNAWRIALRAIKQYSSQNDISLFLIHQITNNDTALVLGEQTDFVYDSLDRRKSETLIKYNTNIARWDSFVRVNYIYANNLLIDHQTSDFFDTTNNTWNTIRKQSYVYDLQDTLVQVSTSKFNSINHTWLNMELYDNIKWNSWDRDVNNQDNVQSYLYKNWNEAKNEYDTSKSYTKKLLDLNGSYLISTLAYVDGSFVPEQRFEKIFDAHLNKTYYQILNGVNGQWSNFYEEAFDYTYGSNDELLEKTDWVFNFNIGQLKKQQRTRFENFLVLGDEILKKANLLVYPNPASDFVYINCNGKDNFIVQLINLNGEILIKKEMNSTEKLIFPELPNGLYFIKVIAEGTYSIEKCIIN